MAKDRVLSLQMANGFELDVDVTTPDVVEARIESHVCYYASYENSLSHCNFSLTFWNPAPEPDMGLGLGVLLLAAFVRKRGTRVGRGC